MKEISKKLLDSLGNNVWQYAEIPVKDIVIDEKVREACKSNYCGKYGKSWTCPPAVGSLEKMKGLLSRYETAFVFTTKHAIEDSFDFEGMMTAREKHEQIESQMNDIINQTHALVLRAGSCSICKKCTYPDAPCRFPDKARPSVESCGINVVRLAKDCNINYHNGENTVTYFGVVLYNN